MTLSISYLRCVSYFPLLTPKTAPSRQTLIFSATLPEMLAQFARAGLNNPKVIRLNTEHKLPDTLETKYFIVRQGEKYSALMFLLKEFISRDKQIIVFTATKHHAEFLQTLLSSMYNEVRFRDFPF